MDLRRIINFSGTLGITFPRRFCRSLDLHWKDYAEVYLYDENTIVIRKHNPETKEVSLDESKSENKQESCESSFEIISLDRIDDPERPIRKNLASEDVQDLVVSIRQVGIIEPLVVMPKGDRYEVIAGHRRLIAAGIADVALVPCYIVNISREQSEILKIHENLYRQNVKPSDEAEHFKFMIQTHKLSPTKIAKLCGRSDGYVTDRLAIFNYPPELARALDQEKIKFSVAREFSRIDDRHKMREYLHYAIRNGITADLARQWVQDWKRSISEAVHSVTYTAPNDSESSIVDSFSTCVYCKEKISLSEANVVYIHDTCLRASKIDPEEKEQAV